MPQRELLTFEEWPDAPVRATLYPWAKLMDGGKYMLVRGRDFHTAARVMKSTITAHAKRHDIAVRTRIARNVDRPQAEPKELFVQFYPGRPYADGPPPTS